MFTPPGSVLNQYDTALKGLMIPINQYADYKKWLRYFLDFRAKYTAEMNNTSEQLRLSLEKLREKKQSEEQRRQAEHAVKLYVDMREGTGTECVPDAPALESGNAVTQCPLPAGSTGQQPQYIWARPGSARWIFDRNESSSACFGSVGILPAFRAD